MVPPSELFRILGDRREVLLRLLRELEVADAVDLAEEVDVRRKSGASLDFRSAIETS